MRKKTSLGSKEDVLRVKELMLTVSDLLEFRFTHNVRIIIDELHKVGLITDEEMEKQARGG